VSLGLLHVILLFNWLPFTSWMSAKILYWRRVVGIMVR